MTILTVPTPEFPTIQSAVKAAMPGDTVEILQGVYNENIVVQGKNDIVIRGKATNSVAISALDQNAIGIDISEDSYEITIENMNIFNFSAGILLKGDKCRLLDIGINNSIFNGLELRGNENIIYNIRLIQNLIGLGMDGNSNIITNNVFFGNIAAGIVNIEIPAKENVIKNNSITQSQIGIVMNAKNSIRNKFLNNIISLNTTGFVVQSQGNEICSNIIGDNKHDGLDILNNNNIVTRNVINSNQNGVIVVSNENRIVGNVIIGNECKDIINTGNENDISNNTLKDWYLEETL